MSNNKQSSVEWLITELNRVQELYYGQSIMPIEVIAKAKAMHKEEIMEANSIGYRDGIMYANGEDWVYINSEHYYNETFNNNEN